MGYGQNTEIRTRGEFDVAACSHDQKKLRERREGKREDGNRPSVTRGAVGDLRLED